MESLSAVSGGFAYAGNHIQPPKADAQQITEFENMMSQQPQGTQLGFDRYVNGADTPAQWLSETLVKAGKEISTNYREGLEKAAMKMEQLDPNDPMMLPKLANLQMQIHNATFQLQFTTSLVHLANNGVKTLFNLQG
jgi:hypothetical protein